MVCQKCHKIKIILDKTCLCEVESLIQSTRAKKRAATLREQLGQKDYSRLMSAVRTGQTSVIKKLIHPKHPVKSH